MVSIRAYPKQYIYSIFNATIFYFWPASFFYEFKATPKLLLDWESFDRSIFFHPLFKVGGSQINNPNEFLHFFFLIVSYTDAMEVAYIVLILIGGIYLVRSLFGKIAASPEQPVYVFLFFMVIYISIVSNVAELQMNYRFRFMADPYALLLAGVGINWLWNKGRSWLKPSRS
jgi:hypothetical protein